MLPFSRILEYGNTVEGKVNIVKYKRSLNYSAAIDSNNQLWWYGYNTYGGSGSGDTDNVFSWRVTNRNVTNIWTNQYNTTIVRTAEQKYYWCGQDSWYTGVWPGNAHTTWTEISFLSSKNVKHIEIGQTYVIALIGTELYGCGLNYGGVFNGSSVVAIGTVSNWVKISSTYVVDEFLVSNDNVFIKTSNSLMACGTNSNLIISGSTSNTTVLTWTSILSIAPMTNNPLSYAFKASNYGLVIRSSNLNMYVRGSTSNYQLANNVNTGVIGTTTLVSSLYPNAFTVDTMLYTGSDATNILLTMYVSAGKLYGGGTQVYGELGTGDKAVKQVPVEIPLTINPDDPIIAIVGTQQTITIYTPTKVLISGRYHNGTAFVESTTFIEAPTNLLPADWTLTFDSTVRPWF